MRGTDPRQRSARVYKLQPNPYAVRQVSPAPPPVARPTGVMGELPQAVLSSFSGPKDTLDKMAQHILGDFGEKSMLVRHFTEWVVSSVQPKDYLGEILAIRNSLVQASPFKPGVPLVHYANDPLHVELVKTPDRMVREILDQGTTVCDCDDTSQLCATMLLQVGRVVELVAMGFQPGSLSHVGVRAKEPKSGRWIWCDGVAGPREAEAAGRAKELLVLSLD